MFVCFVAFFIRFFRWVTFYTLLQHSPFVSKLASPDSECRSGFAVVCPKFPIVFKVCHSTLNALTFCFFFCCWLIRVGFFFLPVSLRYFFLLLPPSGTMTCSDLAGTTVRKFYTTTVSKWVVLQTRFCLRKKEANSKALLCCWFRCVFNLKDWICLKVLEVDKSYLVRIL